ncbi:LysE family translocator [Ferrovibrio terrae]|uniref:LysE family translocator n=1 Tax=Ferrovibrio terrae TaxID=2594003 RepID=A0A516H0I5_9PROT|nr:LysE family translocator [Ferrovibrio terrae]QDO97274.1 LysE family translocator [Ferrovibrio terrae]
MPVSLELWLAFIAAASIMILIPGPTTMMVLGHTMAGGPRTGALSLIGVTLGDVCAIALSMLGFSALLAASAEAFTAMKWIGAVYLVYLGIRLWRAPPMDLTPANTGKSSARDAILQTFLVTLLNPKGILFFAAFLPQFIDPTRPLWPQVAMLTVTMNVLAAGIQGCWIVMMGQARNRIASPRMLKNMNRAGGAMLVGAGMLTATLKRG